MTVIIWRGLAGCSTDRDWTAAASCSLRCWDAGANWGKAKVLMWNLIEMYRSKVPSIGSAMCLMTLLCSGFLPPRCWLTVARQKEGKVTVPLHHLHHVKWHCIRQQLMKTFIFSIYGQSTLRDWQQSVWGYFPLTANLWPKYFQFQKFVWGAGEGCKKLTTKQDGSWHFHPHVISRQAKCKMFISKSQQM